MINVSIILGSLEFRQHLCNSTSYIELATFWNVSVIPTMPEETKERLDVKELSEKAAATKGRSQRRQDTADRRESNIKSLLESKRTLPLLSPSAKPSESSPKHPIVTAITPFRNGKDEEDKEESQDLPPMMLRFDEQQQEECHEDPCGDAAMDNGATNTDPNSPTIPEATSDDNTRKVNKDEPDNSLLAPREEQSTPSIIPSPDGTYEKTGEGEDPTLDEENGNAERPFFNPSLDPDGVFAKFLVKHKVDINAHDQQALWGETCAHDTLGIDTNQHVLENFHKQIIYDQVCPTVDLCASDQCPFSTELIAPATIPTQQPDMTIFGKDILHHHPNSTFFHTHKITTTPNTNAATHGPNGPMPSTKPCKKPLISVLCTKVPSFSREWKTIFRRRHFS